MTIEGSVIIRTEDFAPLVTGALFVAAAAVVFLAFLVRAVLALAASSALRALVALLGGCVQHLPDRGGKGHDSTSGGSDGGLEDTLTGDPACRDRSLQLLKFLIGIHCSVALLGHTTNPSMQATLPAFFPPWVDGMVDSVDKHNCLSSH